VFHTRNESYGARVVTVLFDLGHPAHFHLFKHVIAHLRQTGHDVELIARQKECLQDLLDKVGWRYHLAPRSGTGLAALGRQAAQALQVAVRLSLAKPIDVMAGTSIVVGPAARMTGATSLVFGEDDARTVPWFARLAYPPAHYIVTPRCLRFERHGRKHLTYPGYQELAYLHPDRFQPDPSVRSTLGVQPEERYFLVRLVALTAHHDIGQRGVSRAQARRLVEKLARHGRVFISAETKVDDDLQPYVLPTRPDQIFDVLAFADMVVGDSQTVTAEAAVLGTPAIRCNTFVGRLTYLEELEHRYGLTVGIRPEHFDRVLGTVDAWLAKADLKSQWRRRRHALISECVDLTEWILDLFTGLIRRRR